MNLYNKITLNKMKLLILISLLFVTGSLADGDNGTVKVSFKICTECHCDQKLKILDCSHLKLNDLYKAEDWNSLISSDSGGVVKSIQLNNNNITNLKQFPSINVEELNLSHNKMVKIEDGVFRNLTKLTSIDLSNNLLTTAALTPKVLDGNYDASTYEPLKTIKILRLSSNSIHSLNIDIFEHLPALEELYLDFNPFRVIDRSTEVAISGIANLKVLDMSYMELKELPIHMFHSPIQLNKLNITGNFFPEIPEALTHAVNLVELTINENYITIVDSEHAFPNLTKLEKLSFAHVPKLSSIGKGAFSKLINLKYLDISHNRNLSNVDGKALCNHGQVDTEREEWPPLTILKMDNNNLTYLDSHLLARWDELTTIDLHNNPWACECENQWMIDTLMPMMANSTTDFADKVICASPIEMKDLHLSELGDKRSHLRCLDKYGNRPERDGSILIGILVGVLIGIPLALASLWIWKRGCFGLLGSGGAGDFSRAYYKRAGNQDDFYI